MVISLIIGILTLVCAHLLRVYRWRQFIEVYEKPNDKRLIRSLSIGYAINFFAPFHIGDIFRAFYSGKKMKNGVIFSISTIIVEYFLDIFFVAIIFSTFYLLTLKNNVISSSIIFYISFVVLFIFLGIIIFKHNKYVKKIAYSISGIFNEKIELKLLKLFWALISSFKDIVEKLNKIKLILTTILMWSLYLCSYSLLAYAIKINASKSFNVVDIFTSFFSMKTFIKPTLYISFNMFDKYSYIMVIYIVISLLLLFITSFFFKFNQTESNKEYLELLPHINPKDRLTFLESYFSAENKEYFKNYLKINRDISILQDYSAGSNATTMLCTDDSGMFFRKYSFGNDSEKLWDQIKWLHAHEKKLVLTKILRENHGIGYCYYDMPYRSDAVGCFNYVHSNTLDKGWRVIEMVLDDLDKNLHQINVRKSDPNLIKNYIDKKVTDNIKIMENSKELKNIMKYDTIFINGKEYKNLKQFKKYFKYEYLYNLFKDDVYADLHGDMTIENIICLNDDKLSKPYYIIDPNTGNVHDSPNLDYAKLLQSLHGGYEFLMHTTSVEFHHNHINYLHTQSSIYDELFKKYKEYLESKFSRQKVKSIFFHEIIHWFRLMPYKIRKDSSRAVLFYAGMIKVINDVIEFYGENDEK
ncbi:MAG: flippase-like domain-containing protein [Bacilli bacterium]|nr:flippase-like domain-containing protein [Bacilli bacterium]